MPLTIREHRTSRQMKQSDLAERAGVSERDLRRYERGETTPSVLVAARIAKALEVRIDDLIPRPERHTASADRVNANGAAR